MATREMKLRNIKSSPEDMGLSPNRGNLAKDSHSQRQASTREAYLPKINTSPQQVASVPPLCPYPTSICFLQHKTLNLGLDGADLVGQLGGLVGGDGASDDGTADTGGTAKGHLQGS